MVNKLKHLFNGMIVVGGVSLISALYGSNPRGRFSSPLDYNLVSARDYYSQLTNQIAQSYSQPYDSKNLEDKFGPSSEGQEALVDLLTQKSEVVKSDIKTMEAIKQSVSYKEKTKSRNKLIDSLIKYGVIVLGAGFMGRYFFGVSNYDKSKQIRFEDHGKYEGCD